MRWRCSKDKGQRCEHVRAAQALWRETHSEDVEAEGIGGFEEGQEEEIKCSQMTRQGSQRIVAYDCSD